MSTSNLILVFFVALGCMGLGALAYERWLGHVVASRRKVARRQPLRRKPLVNKDELLIWHWLKETFPEQTVLLKMPLASFAEPNSIEGDAHWIALLGPVSFSCVVADRTGTVLGCVDVLRKGELLDRRHAFKRELLGRAGIPYWAIDTTTKPAADLIREKFLAFIPYTDPKRRAPQTAPASLSAHFTRVASQASALTSIGISPAELRATLSLDSLTQALASRPSGIGDRENNREAGLAQGRTRAGPLRQADSDFAG